MLIAFTADPHGNLPALAAAVADARERGARRIYCAGDLTGYGPFPAGVIRFLESERIPTISGNYDLKVIEAVEEESRLKKRMKPAKWKILEWTARRMTRRDLRYLRRLPAVHRETLPSGAHLLVVHGSPVSNTDTIYPSVTAPGLRGKIGDEQIDILVCGHTHIPFVRRIGGVLVVNCGSVGFPVDGDPRPAYALIEVPLRGAAGGRIVRFAYDVEATAGAIPGSGLPKSLMKDFREGNKKRETP
jgi:predicted phosphodiesterase